MRKSWLWVVKKTIEGKEKIYDLDFLLEDPEKHIAVVKKIYNFLDLEWKNWQFPSVSETKNIFIRKEKISEDVFEIAISYLKEKELFIVSPDLFFQFPSDMQYNSIQYLLGVLLSYYYFPLAFFLTTHIYNKSYVIRKFLKSFNLLKSNMNI